MNIDFLDTATKIALHLEAMYYDFGYRKYKMNRFEPYSFYMENENFLEDSRVITIQASSGKLLALKPDVTMSIVKNHKSYDKTKIYYNEPVFKVPAGESDFKEIQQVGLEYIGSVNINETIEVLHLAIKSLEKIGEFKFLISDMSIVNELFSQYEISPKDRKEIIKRLKQRNMHELAEYPNVFQKLIALPANCHSAIAQMEGDSDFTPCLNRIARLKQIIDDLAEVTNMDKIMFDFSNVTGTQYYNGLTFTGYIQGIASKVLSGGRYDNLLKEMGEKDKEAIGFAVYLTEIDGAKKYDKSIITQS
ncbi:MAG: hypothetical protein ATN31_06980 [Candidatus Epulonipiscioides saccharophilum]|nr:MAG: hypothetical protein ATN31_06980 [Epulopiscium sp. AS2M-Bin001]